MGEPVRLTPTMRSRKLQALDFIKGYFARWGQSPSLDEIGAFLGVSKQRASYFVHQLAVEQMITLTGKRRGIALVDRGEELTEADVLARLKRLGWRIDAERRIAILPPEEEDDVPLTKNGLTELPELDHE